MGAHPNKHKKNHSDQPKEIDRPPPFKAIRDSFESIELLQEALQKGGLESSNLIIGVDYTISNTDAGKLTYGGRSLHSINPQYMNPYQHVISTVARTLSYFDDDKLIPAYGFGDKATKEKSVFPFFPNERPCNGVEEVLARYCEITPAVELGGPTSFAPIIDKAIQIVQQQGNSYHILIIIADGQVTPDSQWCSSTADTIKSIVRASNHPLSIIVVGVGDGPWDDMIKFDDELPARKFDNFQFVNFYKEYSGVNPETNFALAALHV